jgi:hypothetical protein
VDNQRSPARVRHSRFEHATRLNFPLHRIFAVNMECESAGFRFFFRKRSLRKTGVTIPFPPSKASGGSLVSKPRT